MKPVCGKCIHYRVTWDPAAPHGCKAFEIKSRRIPSQVVLQSSGSECSAYQPKPDPDERRTS